MKNTFVAIDVETTGLHPSRGDRVIEIGAVRVAEGRIVEEFSELIWTNYPIHPSALKVHGITLHQLKGKPPAAEVIPKFRQFIGECMLLAHNAPFDIGFLRKEYALLGLSWVNQSHCTLRESRSRFPGLPSHRLEDVARHLLGPLPADQRLHRALDDARLVAQIWMVMKYGVKLQPPSQLFL